MCVCAKACIRILEKADTNSYKAPINLWLTQPIINAYLKLIKK